MTTPRKAAAKVVGVVKGAAKTVANKAPTGRATLANGLAVGVLYAGFIVDTAFASKAPQTAGLAALHNAWLLVGLPIALFGQAIGQSVFPRLAGHAAAGEWGHLRSSLLRTVATVLILAVPAVIGLLVLGRPTIRVLFQHGSYGAVAAGLTYSVLVPYAIGLPAYVLTEVVTRGLIALRDTRTPLLTNSIQLLGRATIMAITLGAVGVRAIPIAFAVMASVEALILLGVLSVKVQRRLQLAPATGTVGMG